MSDARIAYLQAKRQACRDWGIWSSHSLGEDNEQLLPFAMRNLQREIELEKRHRGLD